MTEAYNLAEKEIISSLHQGGAILDCGADKGGWYDRLCQKLVLQKDQYYGIEWNKSNVEVAVQSGLNVLHGNLNKSLPYDDEKFDCIFALSVLEHLLNGCQFIREANRTLKKDGKFIILTPNISTYFTAFLILGGKMPSSGPHPDSDALLKSEEFFKVSSEKLVHDTETDSPSHRHLVVFSYSVLEKYLKMAGFTDVRGYGFGLYPFPNFMQSLLEKIDPCHCHQMVFIARK